VIRHRDVADYNKAIALPHFFEDLQKQIAPLWACQPRLAMITTTGEEVEIVVARVALEASGHYFNLLEGQL